MSGGVLGRLRRQCAVRIAQRKNVELEIVTVEARVEFDRRGELRIVETDVSFPNAGLTRDMRTDAIW